jgi:DNA replication protein DnaC
MTSDEKIKAGFPAQAVSATWEYFEQSNPVECQKLRNYIQKRPKQGIFITGPYGTGKTSVLGLLADFFNPATTKYISAVRMPTHIVQWKEKPVERINAVRASLMFDDLGAGEQSYTVRDAVEALLCERYDKLSRTIITSNHTVEALSTMPGYERIADRLLDPAWMLHLPLIGASKRQKKGQISHSTAAK